MQQTIPLWILSKELTNQYGKGFAKTNLYSYYLFYKTYPEIFHTACGKSELLSWSHYRLLIYVDDSKAREWYQNEAFQQTWSFRTLQRNINTQYYYRLLQSQDKNAVEREMKDKTLDYQNDKLEFIKNSIIAEFMGLSSSTDMTENDLETAILNNLQKFLMELGKGYAFVARNRFCYFIFTENTFLKTVCRRVIWYALPLTILPMRTIGNR